MTTSDILDPVALENLRDMVGGDDEFLGELIQTFLSDAPQMLADMQRSVQTGDMVVLHRAAHTLKSNSAEFGAMALSALCKELEMMGKTGVLDGADEKVARATAEYEKVQAALEALLHPT